MSGQDKLAAFVAAHRDFWGESGKHLASVRVFDQPATHLNRDDLEETLTEIRAYREKLANGDQYLAAAQMRALNAERKVERLERELRERTSW